MIKLWRKLTDQPLPPVPDDQEARAARIATQDILVRAERMTPHVDQVVSRMDGRLTLNGFTYGLDQAFASRRSTTAPGVHGV